LDEKEADQFRLPVKIKRFEPCSKFGQNMICGSRQLSAVSNQLTAHSLQLTAYSENTALINLAIKRRGCNERYERSGTVEIPERNLWMIAAVGICVVIHRMLRIVKKED
jgi:hypothetical protein